MTIRNYRIGLEFDGTAFHGWQRQPERRTVQGVLERAIAETVGHPVAVQGCSRTDAGVHAVGYVANFKADSELPAERMRMAICSRLPEDVAATACEFAPEGFDACSSALAKEYSYTTVHGGVKPAVRRAFVNYCPQGLKFEPMREAAKHLVGQHDFAGFVNQLEPGKNTVRTVFAAALASEGNCITMTFVGDGFLYNMVRIMAGSLVQVGRRTIAPEQVGRAVNERDRTLAGPTARAKGLALVKVFYEQAELAKRIAELNAKG